MKLPIRWKENSDSGRLRNSGAEFTAKEMNRTKSGFRRFRLLAFEALYGAGQSIGGINLDGYRGKRSGRRGSGSKGIRACPAGCKKHEYE